MQGRRPDRNVGDGRKSRAGVGAPLAPAYERFAVDFDGSGRRDLIGSVPDVLASTTNYLRGYGWRPGGPRTRAAVAVERRCLGLQRQ